MLNSNPSTRIKVTFKKETKKFKRPDSFSTLLTYTQKAFGASLPSSYKFFYQDSENDIISISN